MNFLQPLTGDGKGITRPIQSWAFSDKKENQEILRLKEMEAAVHPVEAGWSGHGTIRSLVSQGTDVVVTGKSLQCWPEVQAVALGGERGRITSMGRRDCGIENQACLIIASLCQDGCFAGDISDANCTMSGKLARSMDGMQSPLR